MWMYIGYTVAVTSIIGLVTYEAEDPDVAFSDNYLWGAALLATGVPFYIAHHDRHEELQLRMQAFSTYTRDLGIRLDVCAHGLEVIACETPVTPNAPGMVTPGAPGMVTPGAPYAPAPGPSAPATTQPAPRPRRHRARLWTRSHRRSRHLRPDLLARVDERLLAVRELDLDALAGDGDHRAAPELRVLDLLADRIRLPDAVGARGDLGHAPGDARELGEAVDERRHDRGRDLRRALVAEARDQECRAA